MPRRDGKSSKMGETAITKRQDERYVIQHAKLLVHEPDFAVVAAGTSLPQGIAQALRDLRTAVVFLEAHGEEEAE
jgi:hypothetical protein